MKKLADIKGDVEIESGTVLRWFGVNRFDKETNGDYYDVLVIEVSTIIPDTWLIIN